MKWLLLCVVFASNLTADEAPLRASLEEANQNWKHWAVKLPKIDSSGPILFVTHVETQYGITGKHPIISPINRLVQEFEKAKLPVIYIRNSNEKDGFLTSRTPSYIVKSQSGSFESNTFIAADIVVVGAFSEACHRETVESAIRSSLKKDSGSPPRVHIPLDMIVDVRARDISGWDYYKKVEQSYSLDDLKKEYQATFGTPLIQPIASVTEYETFRTLKRCYNPIRTSKEAKLTPILFVDKKEVTSLGEKGDRKVEFHFWSGGGFDLKTFTTKQAPIPTGKQPGLAH